MKKVIVMLAAAAAPFLLAARYNRIAPGQTQAIPKITPIRQYGRPVAPEIPALKPQLPPAMRPHYDNKPGKPVPPKPKPDRPPKPHKPHKPHKPEPHVVHTPRAPLFYYGEPREYTYAWYKDGYVILYKGWFWYKKQWVWGGQGKAPAPPSWRPE